MHGVPTGVCRTSTKDIKHLNPQPERTVALYTIQFYPIQYKMPKTNSHEVLRHNMADPRQQAVSTGRILDCRINHLHVRLTLPNPAIILAYGPNHSRQWLSIAPRSTEEKGRNQTSTFILHLSPLPSPLRSLCGAGSGWPESLPHLNCCSWLDFSVMMRAVADFLLRDPFSSLPS